MRRQGHLGIASGAEGLGADRAKYWLYQQETRLLNRREFNGYCAALSLSLPAVGTMTAALSSASAIAAGLASESPGRTVKFHDDTIVPAVGQGSARRARQRSAAISSS
jgi:hypothetical protein